jgi:hypothetical protein
MSCRTKLLLLAGMAVACSIAALAQNSAELPSGPMKAKATTACLECHESRIILQQRLSKASWTKEVDKMIKWGALIDANDHDALIDYLSANFGTDQPAYEPDRTSGKKSAKSATQKLK